MEKFNLDNQERAILVGVHRGDKDSINDSTEESLEELGRLADTAGAKVLATVLQNRPSIESSTYIGEGKVKEVKNACQHLEASLLIFDDELTGSQVRNLENIMGIKVIDRSMLILDIFAKRATTKEGKIQVELAQLKYLLPRLIGVGASLSRLGGGIGTRGPGETKLETDRRHIRQRIKYLESELEKIKKHREIIRNRRKKERFPVVALVGYTNAGKSSLMNLLTNANVLEEDKLFATLDPTIRNIQIDEHENILLVDTVGFIRKLPHHLIEAFKSTLEEAVSADLLLHVIDSSSEEIQQHMQVVNNLLKELNALSKPIITVYNKIDLIDANVRLPQNLDGSNASVEVSAYTGEGILDLLKLIKELIPKKKIKVKVCIPYSQGQLVNQIHQTGDVLSEEYIEQGVAMEIIIDQIMFARIKDFII